MILITALLVILADRITKFMVVQQMMVGEQISVMDNILSITYVKNYGAGFGILSNQRLFLIVVGGLMLMVLTIIIARYRPVKAWEKIGFGLLLGGALGNLWDRIRWGHVVDFIDVHFWPVFNVADMAIVCSLFFFGYYILTVRSQEVTGGELNDN